MKKRNKSSMNGHAKVEKEKTNEARYESVMDEFYHLHLLQLLFQHESMSLFNSEITQPEKKEKISIKKINKSKRKKNE